MILNFCICIPTYNNAGTIEAVVKDCLEKTPYSILVVDDGSDIPVQFNEQNINERVKILRLDTNQGKGVALQRAFKEAIRLGFTHLISLDGDGQHYAQEVSKLVTLSLENPWNLIIGCRRLVSDNVPEISKFGRKFSNFWVRFQTEETLSDSQSGFRLYPLFHVQNLKFWTRRFDFEIEVLIRLLWRGVHVSEVEIECYYPSPEERVSHFDKLWDNVRISVLNTVFVTLSLMRSNRSPAGTAFAVGLGVLVGTTPFYGFHALMAGVLAFCFRLNALYLILGTQISIPPLVPFLAIGSIAVGKWVTHSASVAHLSALQYSARWIAGSLILGVGLGVVIGGITYFLLRSLQNRHHKKQAAWNGKSRGGRFGNGFLKRAIQLGGLNLGYRFLYWIVPYFYVFAPRARRASNEYWLTVAPGVGFWRRQWLVLKHLYTFAQTLLDRVYQGFYQQAKNKLYFETRRQGIENILEPLKKGKGLIMLSAHVGSWEIAATVLKEDGLDKQFNMVRYEPAAMSFDKLRNQNDPEHIHKINANQEKQSVLQIREYLIKGLPVGIMGDRPVGAHFELVTFFGKLAPFDSTPFRIAAICETPLLFTYGFKGPKTENGSSYEFSATPSRYYRYDSGKDRSLQLLEWVQEFAKDLERALRDHPDQWFNFYPFWSTLPVPPEGVEVSRVSSHSKTELGKLMSAKPQSVTDSKPSAEKVFQL